MSGEDLDPKARRIKSLLSSYYGVDDTEPTDPYAPLASSYHGDDASSTTSVHTPVYSSIDTPAFHCDGYVSTLLKNARIDTLLRKHEDLSREIKALDSDMQMLVYENYNKFISATDTIRSMKSNVDRMGKNMENLGNIMESVSQTSDSVNSKLQKHRDKIEELNRLRILLQKIQEIVDLPKNLRLLLEQGDYETAINSYSEAKPVFDKYGDQGTFRTVAIESNLVIEDIAIRLEEELRLKKCGSPEHCICLLRKVGGKEDELQRIFLEGRSCIIKEELKKESKMVESIISIFFNISEPSEISENWLISEKSEFTPNIFVENLNGSILGTLSETVSAFEATFLSNTENESVPEYSKALLAMAEESLDEYFSLLHKALAAVIAIKALEVVNSKRLTKQQSEVSFKKADWGAKKISEALSKVSRDVGSLKGCLSDLDLKSKCPAFVKSVLDYHMSCCFTAISQAIIDILDDIKETSKNKPLSPSTSSSHTDTNLMSLQETYQKICVISQNGLSSLLNNLKAYEKCTSLMGISHGAFIDALQEKLDGIFSFLMAAFKSFAELPNKRLKKSEEEKRRARNIKNLNIYTKNGKGYNLENLILEFTEASSKDPAGSLSSNAMIEGKAEVEMSHISLLNPGVISCTILLCAKISRYLEASVIPFVVELLASLYPSAGDREIPAFKPTDIIRKLNACSLDLVRSFVNIYSRKLSIIIQRSISAADWLNHKEPRGPRPVCDLIYAKLGETEREITELLDDDSSGPSLSQSQTPTHRAKQSTGGEIAEGTSVERNVAKLFQQRTEVQRTAELRRSSIQAAIASVGLKSHIECLRLETLNRAGLQQIQLDTYYLRMLLEERVSGKESDAVSALLDEVLVAATERSTDPTLLEVVVIEDILARYKAE